MHREADLFEAIDATTGTNAKVDALARYFVEAEDQDKLWVIALLSGRRPKRPVTSTQLRQWATEISGIPDWLFEASYHVVGDFAETVTHIATLQEPITKSLTQWVRYVEDLRACTEEEKAGRVKAAWSGLQGMELFVFNKIITGGFRIGVSQKIMVKGLSKATGVEEDVLSHRLMGDWDPHTTTFDRLILEASSTDNDSRPYPFYLAYPIEGLEGTATGALLKDVEALGPPQEWQAEHKWDGIRGQLIVRNGAHYVWSRGEELVTDKYPEFEPLRAVLSHGTVIDGEILAWKDGAPLPFAEMQKRIGRKTVGKKILTDVPVLLMAYDLLEFEGRDIRQRPMSERRELLERIVADASHPSLVISGILPFATWEELVAHREAARIGAVEGIMLKRKTSTYEVGRRRGDWWKWKVDPLSIDAVLTFSMQGHGRRADLYTDHTFGLWHNGELVTFAKAYSGLTDEEMKAVDAFVKKNTVERFGPVRKVTPQLVFEIGFEGISASTRHKSGVAVRFPRIVRWRRDKKIEEANTLDDLKALVDGPSR
ncbi:MAG TPA: ATP-dependent DNA ligase [Flavobacteriales bacterium]|nr:ATP-dependent DNA ligase [Flavobacteriales bacterium]HNU57047.1 ATP-dependent DNA ligase [Flavobacteriales bacterium]